MNEGERDGRRGGELGPDGGPKPDGGTGDASPIAGVGDWLPGPVRLARWLLLAVALGAVGVAMAFLLNPGLLTATGVGPAFAAFVESLPMPVWRVGQLVGALALLFVLAALVGVWRSESASAVETAVEDRVAPADATTAGRDIDDALADLRAAAGADPDVESDRLSETLRRELEATAVTVVARAEDCDGEAATRKLEAGTWTTDARAAAFFGDVDPPWYVRVRDFLSPTPAAVRRAEHAVAALEELVEEGETSVDDASDGTRRDGDGDVTDRSPDEHASGVAPWQTRRSVDGEDAISDTSRLDVDGEKEEVGGVRVRSVGNAAGLLAVAVGVATATPLAVLLGILGVVYGLLDRVTTTPTAPVEVTREVGSSRPSPGDVVEVRVTVHNTGDDALPDVRVVDGVPEPLAVVEGSPGLHTALRPGESDDVTYAVRAKRGTFAFDEAAVVRRNVAGTNAVTAAAAPATPVRCATMLEEFPLHEQARAQAGRAPTDRGGEGIEFHATREYRRGDPPGRIDWNQLAKTGELTTIQYRDQGTPTVVLLLDAREAVMVAPDPADLDGLDLSIYAAERTLFALLEQGASVGVMVYDGETLRHEPPDSAGAERTRLSATLGDASERYDTLTDAGDAATQAVTAGQRPLEQVRRQLPSKAQVVLFSPAVDEFPLTASRALVAAGHPTTVLSPATVGDDSLGQRTSRLERACLLRATRETGAYVVDWDTGESVETAVTRVARRHRS